jgi:two-component system response regulator WspF
MKIGLANHCTATSAAIRHALGESIDHQLVWVAHNGPDAVRLCAETLPDLVLMDLDLPQLDGIEATRSIMASSPCAILIVTPSPQDQQARVFRALGAGALDVAAAPTSASGNGGDGQAELLAKIRTIAMLVTGERPGAGPAARKLVAIGASTGGPLALARLLGNWRLPPDTAAVVIQHIDNDFAGRLVHWLAEQSCSPVRAIAGGERLRAGTIHIAASDRHVRLESGERLVYDANPREAAYRPSVDVFFHSVALLWRHSATGILLTGMGSDGAAGLLALRRAGHETIAQDQASSAVYGMPRAAARLDAAGKILSLDDILATLQARAPAGR